MLTRQQCTKNVDPHSHGSAEMTKNAVLWQSTTEAGSNCKVKNLTSPNPIIDVLAQSSKAIQLIM